MRLPCPFFASRRSHFWLLFSSFLSAYLLAGCCSLKLNSYREGEIPHCLQKAIELASTNPLDSKTQDRIAKDVDLAVKHFPLLKDSGRKRFLAALDNKLLLTAQAKNLLFASLAVGQARDSASLRSVALDTLHHQSKELSAADWQATLVMQESVVAGMCLVASAMKPQSGELSEWLHKVVLSSHVASTKKEALFALRFSTAERTADVLLQRIGVWMKIEPDLALNACLALQSVPKTDSQVLQIFKEARRAFDLFQNQPQVAVQFPSDPCWLALVDCLTAMSFVQLKAIGQPFSSLEPSEIVIGAEVLTRCHDCPSEVQQQAMEALAKRAPSEWQFVIGAEKASVSPKKLSCEDYLSQLIEQCLDKYATSENAVLIVRPLLQVIQASEGVTSELSQLAWKRLVDRTKDEKFKELILSLLAAQRFTIADEFLSSQVIAAGTECGTTLLSAARLSGGVRTVSSLRGVLAPLVSAETFLQSGRDEFVTLSFLDLQAALDLADASPFAEPALHILCQQIAQAAQSTPLTSGQTLELLRQITSILGRRGLLPLDHNRWASLFKGIGADELKDSPMEECYATLLGARETVSDPASIASRICLMPQVDASFLARVPNNKAFFEAASIYEQKRCPLRLHGFPSESEASLDLVVASHRDAALVKLQHRLVDILNHAHALSQKPLLGVAIEPHPKVKGADAEVALIHEYFQQHFGFTHRVSGDDWTLAPALVPVQFKVSDTIICICLTALFYAGWILDAKTSAVRSPSVPLCGLSCH
jgi:hypothetical protein